MGTVDGRSYDGQLKYIIRDAMPLDSEHILKPIFSQLRYIHCAYYSLRSPDMAIFVSMTMTTMTTTRPITLPLAHARRVIILL